MINYQQLILNVYEPIDSIMLRICKYLCLIGSAILFYYVLRDYPEVAYDFRVFAAVLLLLAFLGLQYYSGSMRVTGLIRLSTFGIAFSVEDDAMEFESDEIDDIKYEPFYSQEEKSAMAFLKRLLHSGRKNKLTFFVQGDMYHFQVMLKSRSQREILTDILESLKDVRQNSWHSPAS